jgi:hypothetical protein
MDFGDGRHLLDLCGIGRPGDVGVQHQPLAVDAAA